MFKNSIKKIVTHLPNPSHLDDFIATSLLFSITKAEIDYVHPQKVTQDMLLSKEIALVDVGMSYDPEYNNFDHHQDKNIPCSAVLIKNHFFPEIETNAFLHAVDIIDRFGFKHAMNLGLCKYDDEIDKKRKTILLISVQKAYPHVIYTLKQNVNYEEGIELLYERLQNAYKEEVSEMRKKVEEEVQRLLTVLSKVQILTINDIRIGISHEQISPGIPKAFDLLKLDIIIEPNIFNNNHTSIIVNTSSEKAELAHKLADKLMENYNIIFIHATRFIRVLDVTTKQFARNLLS